MQHRDIAPSLNCTVTSMNSPLICKDGANYPKFLLLFGFRYWYFQLVVLSAVNPSPRWLVAREKMAEARKSIGFFRGKFTKHAECELMDCQHQLKEAKQVQ